MFTIKIDYTDIYLDMAYFSLKRLAIRLKSLVSIGEKCYHPTMKKLEIAKLSQYLVEEYYNNNIAPFLSSMDDDVLWYGPAEGQFIKGREAMLNAWGDEIHSLSFTLGNIHLRCSMHSRDSCTVIMAFSVTTVYPNGVIIPVNERIHLDWIEKKIRTASGEIKKEPKIAICDITNLFRQHEEDNIYPNHFDETYLGLTALNTAGIHIPLKGTDGSDYYLLSDTVMWIETASGGKGCTVHTLSETIGVRDTISELERRYKEIFIRAHSSFLVNPSYIKNVRRFALTLMDQTTLPIPERKYTAFKKRLAEFY